MGEPLLWAGTMLCAAGAVAGLLPLSRRVRLAALSGALALAPVLVIADNWGSERLVDLRERPSLLVAALLLVAIVIAVVALCIRRRPSLLAPLLIGALPFRVPLDLGGGGEPANLLLPLYGLIAAGLLAAWLSEEPRPSAPASGWLRWIGVALAAFVGIYALGAGLADDVSPAGEDVAFFLAPFAALFFLLGEVRWERSTLRAVIWVLAAEALVFAAVAGFQYASGELFWNDKLISGNEAHAYFRVNSLFWDPNILGRYLAVTMVVLATVVASVRDRREQLIASAIFVVLLAPLVVTYSQTSTIALIAGAIVLVAARFGLAAGAVAALAAGLALLASVTLIAGGGLSDESNGRSGLINGGLEIAADAPLVGTGSGSFPAEFKERFGGGRGIAVESHTEPVTVAAEQGAVGLLAYAALLVVTVGGLLSAAGLRLRGPAIGAPMAAALLAVYAVMVVHSIGYAAFLTDPITWAVLAVAMAALAPATRRPPTPTGGAWPA